jgi:hypothetical protein
MVEPIGKGMWEGRISNACKYNQECQEEYRIYVYRANRLDTDCSDYGNKSGVWNEYPEWDNIFCHD